MAEIERALGNVYDRRCLAKGRIRENDPVGAFGRGSLQVRSGRCRAYRHGPAGKSDALWWNARKAKEPHFVKAGLLDLKEALAHLDRIGGSVSAIIDTPTPAITESISQVVAHADLVIVPTRPSPHDLRAVGATVDIAERHGKPLIFVINAATARARITGESAVALSQHGTVAPVTLHQRVDFAASMIDGRTVGEIVPNSQSAREIRDNFGSTIQDKAFRAASFVIQGFCRKFGPPIWPSVPCCLRTASATIRR